jgi:peptidyl-prolyl cis-trans isomerase C
MATMTSASKTLAYALSALALGAFACRRGANTRGEARNVDPSQIVAKVGDAVITVSDVQGRIDKQAPFVRARYVSADKKKELVDGLVQFEVMAAEAARRGYDKDPDVQWVMRQQMVAKWIQRDFDAKLKDDDVPEADVERYYNDHPPEFHQKDEARVRVVFLKDKSRADHVYAVASTLPRRPVLEDDDGFRDLVTKYSTDAESKRLGGELRDFARDSTTVPKPIVEAAFNLNKAGAVAPPLQTDKGWAVIRLSQMRTGFDRSLPQVKKEIQHRLLRDMRSKAMAALVDDLEKKSRITINDDNLAKVVVKAGTGRTTDLSLPGRLEAPISAPPPGTSPVLPVGTRPPAGP